VTTATSNSTGTTGSSSSAKPVKRQNQVNILKISFSSEKFSDN
jgi:hypothetical protein